MTRSWTCPYCNRPTTISKDDMVGGSVRCWLSNNDFGDPMYLYSMFIVCPNTECNKLYLDATLYEATGTGDEDNAVVKTWKLLPPSEAKSFPNYIPKQILQDYEEACLIRDRSPKASATLARRCLQGIIRDFWTVKPNTLKNEIDQIENWVYPNTWRAIEAVRTAGNIGAHMEHDINHIIDVDPEEAQLLIGLIEILLQDWYIAREERETHLEQITSLANKKKEVRKKAPKENTE